MARPQIQQPAPERDAVRAPSVVAVAALGLAVGLLLVRATLSGAPQEAEVDDDAPTTPAEPTEPLADTDASTASPRSAPPDAADGPDGGRSDGAEDASAPTPAEVVAAEPTPYEGGPRRVRPDRVAYIRCDGAEQEGERFPCPRDEALEAAVWETLDRLLTCGTAPEGTGVGDVRLVFRAGEPTDVVLRPPRPSDTDRLDGPALLGCLRPPLSQLQTVIAADHLVISFRFDVVPDR